MGASGEDAAPEIRPARRAETGNKDGGGGASRRSRCRAGDVAFTGPAYGALDLGTNNCRLLVARPIQGGFKVIDAFSRIVRLGENLGRTQRLSEAAMDRTVDALKVCTEKLARRNVAHARLIATEACRTARNGHEFLDRVYTETGLKLEVISRETEARLAVAGSASLIDPGCKHALIFDIGGGSSELMWLVLRPDGYNMEYWTSLPVGVVTLAERFGGRDVSPEQFRAMVDSVTPHLAHFENKVGPGKALATRHGHMLGTSGTVTTLAGVAMGLKRYDRSRVDGCWLTDDDISGVTGRLMQLSYAQRVESPCIGAERADLVLAGCAILQAIMEQWPCRRVRVADRGLREGILTSLMERDGHNCNAQNAGRAGHKSKPRLRRRRRRGRYYARRARP